MLRVFTNIGVALIALLHLWFCTLEMFLWTTPIGLAAFKTTQAFANQSAQLAANQGLYNAFLSAGLLWGLLSRYPQQALRIKTFFLICVLIAGTYAGLTVSSQIFFIQALPAAITLILLYSTQCKRATP